MNARVNQKLYCARLVLDVARHSDGAANTALLEAVLFHLVTAYRCYLNEIVDDQPTAEPTSALHAVRQREQLDLERRPALDELALLEQGGAWPQRMLAAYAEITASTAPQRRGASAIAVADVTASADADNCRSWLDQFQALLQRQRDHAQEW